MEIIEYENSLYPKFQSEGNAAQFAISYAKKFCKGKGYDIGFCKEEWKFPNSIGIDISDTKNEYNANFLPDKKIDYIFSSHCLEHIQDWVHTIEYWISHIKEKGTLFLYLPDFSQKYWRPWNNRKHLHCFNPEIFKEFCKSKKFKKFFISGIDLNNSFFVVIENYIEDK
tara:strand:+ start:496 stop:1002 length:507 start_codon:yes stop_codon:yes gene_type:complete